MSTYPDWQGDLHHQPVDPAKLITAIEEAMRRVPGCTVGRSGNGIGDLCVYDAAGAYVGVIGVLFTDFTLFDA